MGRPLRLLNLALGLVAVLIAGTLAKAWVSPASFITSPSVAKPTQEPTEVAFSRPARPPLAQFDVLLEKNPFKQAPPQPVISQRTNPPRPTPPLPLPTLMGTILVDDQRRAILSDKGKANIYSIGQEVAGGTLTAISEDRVLFKRGDEVSELTLKAPIQPGAPPPPPASAPPPQAAPGSVPPPPPPGAIEGAPSRAALSGADHRRLRLLQQQGLVEPIPTESRVTPVPGAGREDRREEGVSIGYS